MIEQLHAEHHVERLLSEGAEVVGARVADVEAVGHAPASGVLARDLQHVGIQIYAGHAAATGGEVGAEAAAARSDVEDPPGRIVGEMIGPSSGLHHVATVFRDEK